MIPALARTIDPEAWEVDRSAKHRCQMFRRPPLSPEAIEDIAQKRSKGATWLTLSQEYGIPAGVLQWRFQKASKA